MNCRNQKSFFFLILLCGWGLFACTEVKRDGLDTSTPLGFLINFTFFPHAANSSKPAYYPIQQIGKAFTSPDGTFIYANATNSGSSADALLITTDGVKYTAIPVVQSGTQYRIKLVGFYYLISSTRLVFTFSTNPTSGSPIVQRVSQIVYSSTQTSLNTGDTTAFTDIPVAIANNYDSVQAIGPATGNTIFLQAGNTSILDTFYSTDNFATLTAVTGSAQYSDSWFVINSTLLSGNSLSQSGSFTSAFSSPLTLYYASLCGSSNNILLPGSNATNAVTLYYAPPSTLPSLLTPTVTNPDPLISTASSVTGCRFLEINAASLLVILSYTDTSLGNRAVFTHASAIAGTWSSPIPQSFTGTEITSYPASFVASTKAWMILQGTDTSGNTNFYSMSTADGITFTTPALFQIPYNGP